MLIIPSQALACAVWNCSPVPSLFGHCYFWWSVHVSLSVFQVCRVCAPTHCSCSPGVFSGHTDSAPGDEMEPEDELGEQMESDCWEDEISGPEWSLSEQSLIHWGLGVGALKTGFFCKQICSRSTCSLVIQVKPVRPIWKLLYCAEDLSSLQMARNALCWAEFSSILVTSPLVVWCRSAD